MSQDIYTNNCHELQGGPGKKVGVVSGKEASPSEKLLRSGFPVKVGGPDLPVPEGPHIH